MFGGKLFSVTCDRCGHYQSRYGSEFTVIQNPQFNVWQISFYCNNSQCYNQLSENGPRHSRLAVVVNLTSEAAQDIIRFGGKLVVVNWLSYSGRNEQKTITPNYIEWFRNELKEQPYLVDILEKEEG